MSQKIPITVATFAIESFRCRFHPLAPASTQVTAAGYDTVKTEKLHTLDGQQGFTLAQSQ